MASGSSTSSLDSFSSANTQNKVTKEREIALNVPLDDGWMTTFQRSLQCCLHKHAFLVHCALALAQQRLLFLLLRFLELGSVRSPSFTEAFHQLRICG